MKPPQRFNLDTKPYAGHTTQEQVEAARVQAAGKVPRSQNPELTAWAKSEVESRVQRTVVGKYENKGRARMHVLTPDQFASFTSTGEWEGMPTEAEYGPHSAGPDHREWEPL